MVNKKIHMYYMTSHETACGISDSEDDLIYTCNRDSVTCKKCLFAEVLEKIEYLGLGKSEDFNLAIERVKQKIYQISNK